MRDYRKTKQTPIPSSFWPITHYEVRPDSPNITTTGYDNTDKTE